MIVETDREELLELGGDGQQVVGATGNVLMISSCFVELFCLSVFCLSGSAIFPLDQKTKERTS